MARCVEAKAPNGLALKHQLIVKPVGLINNLSRFRPQTERFQPLGALAEACISACNLRKAS